MITFAEDMRNLSKILFINVVIYISFFMPVINAQLVNYEETWQEFLRKEKTSNISELMEPDIGHKSNYLKYALMYANTYFCADNLKSCQEMIDRIESIGEEAQNKIPGFIDRYDKFKIKVKAYKNFAPIWNKFLNDKNSVSREEVFAISDAKTVCEKGTLCKYFYLVARDYFCDNDFDNARDQFDNRVRKLIATSFDYKSIDGLSQEMEKMLLFWEGIDELNTAWDTYVITGVSPGFKGELPVFDCNVLPNLKSCILKATFDLCGEGTKMLKKIKALQKINEHPLSSDMIDVINWIETEVGYIENDLVILNSFWRVFIPNDILPTTANYKHTFRCDREAEIKAYLMDGLSQPCLNGRDALNNIDRIRKQYKPDMGSVTLTKFKKLKSLISNDEKGVAVVFSAWRDFLEDGHLSIEYNFDFEFGHCNKVSEIRSYIIDGTINSCHKGQKRLDDIEKVMVEYDPELDEKTIEKLEFLVDLVEKQTKEINDLNLAWNYFMTNNEVSYDLEYEYDFPCDRILEIKAYLLDAYTDPCLSGAYGLDQLKKVREEYDLDLGHDLLDLIKKLEHWPKKEAKNKSVLDKAWKDFDKDGRLSGKVNFVFEYCDKVSQAKAYIIDGTVNFDTQGRKRLEDMSQLQSDYLLTLNRSMVKRLEWLQNAVAKLDK
ncbi:MAG: hypothetical protein MK207_10895 [Saprospiraceae bacterium]|nr:hypothetical protein [Saprospiraceae bacterium]